MKLYFVLALILLSLFISIVISRPDGLSNEEVRNRMSACMQMGKMALTRYDSNRNPNDVVCIKKTFSKGNNDGGNPPSLSW